jgi:predicted nucleotidyltransferase component of viral defense system
MFTKTLLPDTFRAIKLASSFPEIQKAYLAGGTSLALQIGHRISVDLDFFTREAFDETKLCDDLATHTGFIKDGTAKWTVWGNIGETKFSMFYYDYPLLEPTVAFEGLQLSGLSDIAAMKIHAIEDRGTKRDFIDVYFLAKTFSLLQMVDFYRKKYSISEDRMYMTLRALDYFEDAEKETVMPRMLLPVDWEAVKKYFQKETKELANEILSPNRAQETDNDK